MTVDVFSDGVPSITPVLRPKAPGWREVSMAVLPSPYPVRAFFHDRHCLAVLSAVEVADDGKIDKGPEYHLSVSKQLPASGTHRCTSAEAKWVLEQFGFDGAEEDNHVPNGLVRNFWRPVAHRLIGLECECKAEEPAIVEDKGDFIWRGAPE